MRFAAAMLLVPVLSGCLLLDESPDGAAVVPADIVLTDARLWTTGEEPGFASAIAVRDGRIVYVGDDADAFVGPETQTIQLGGATVMPGWRDHHLHALSSGSTPLEPAFHGHPSDEDQLQGDLQNQAFQTGFHGHRNVLYRASTEGEFETLYEQCDPVDPTAVPGLKAALQRDEAEMAAQGLTTVVDAGMSDLSILQAMREVEAEGLSKIRWLVRVVPGCYEHLDAMAVAPHDGDWAILHGVKLYGDGYLGAWIAALQQPYSDRPGWSGILVYDPDSLDYFVREAAGRGLHVATHAIGDASIQGVLDAYDRAGHTAADRWTVEHVQVTTPAIIADFARIGAVPSIQLSFAVTDQRMAEDRLGAQRVADAYDWRGFLEAGVVVAGGTDWPIEVITPLWGLQREVTRQEVDGSAPFLPDNGMDLAQALGTITFGSAYAAVEDDERGALQVGHIADLTVVREDLFQMPEDEIAGATVILTMTNGKITFQGERSYPPAVP